MTGAGDSGQDQRVPLSESALSQPVGILHDSGIIATARIASINHSLPPAIATSIFGAYCVRRSVHTDPGELIEVSSPR